MQSLIADLAEMGTRKKAVGLYTVVASGGFSSGPVMCSLLLQFVSIKDILLITLGIASIELIMGILLVKERSHGGEAGLIGKNFGNVIRNGNVMYASLALASFFFVDSSIMTFFPIAALNVYGLTPQFVSSVFALRNIVLLFSRVFVVTRVVGKISEKKLFSISLALPLSLALTFFLTGYLSLSIFIILVGVGVGIVFSMGAMIIADSTSSQERGLANAIYFVGMNGGTTLSPIIMGALADVIGVTMIFPVAAFVPVIGLLASLMIKMK
jgi:FSR family fosmidomycin resistance protein-like MFS transporter